MSCGESSCNPGAAHECRCDGGQPKNFLRPCVLLLLAEQSAHGYELLERLQAFGFSRDPGGLYRTLRALEREGLVSSQWEPSDAGPQRCRYELTAVGWEWLRAWADTLDETRHVLEDFLQRYEAVAVEPSPRPGGGARPLARQPKRAVDGPAVLREDSRSFTTVVRSEQP